MSAYVSDEYARANKTIEDYVNNDFQIETSRYWYGKIPEGCPIVNFVMDNGLQPSKPNRIIRELYPGLFDACLEFLKQKNHSTVFVYKVEGKPPVYNCFIKNERNVATNRKIANMRRFLKNSDYERFAYVEDKDNTFDDVSTIRYTFRGVIYFYKFKEPQPRENLLETVYNVPF